MIIHKFSGVPENIYVYTYICIYIYIYIIYMSAQILFSMRSSVHVYAT